MKKPDLKASAGIYTLQWTDSHLVMRFDRLKEDSHYNVSAEVLVRTNLPGYNPHLHHARLNLTSTQSKNSLAKHLKEEYDIPDVRWPEAIEQACVMVLEKYREGEPVIRIADYQPPEQALYRIERLLFEKQPNLILGPGGSLKSFIAVYLAILTLVAGGCACQTTESESTCQEAR